MKLNSFIVALFASTGSVAFAEQVHTMPIGSETYLQYADQALREGRLTQAEQMINWLEQNAGVENLDDIALLKAEFAVVRHDIAGASAALDSMADRSRNLCRQETARGWVNIFKGALDQAILALVNAAENCPSDAGIWNMLGVAFVAKGETVAGKEAFEHGLMLAPDNSELLNNHALALLQNGDLISAREQLESAAKAFPANRVITANHDYVSGMLGQAPVRAKRDSDTIWSERLVNTAKGAKVAERGQHATALFSRALLLLDRFDSNVWAEIDKQTAIRR